MTEEVRIQLNAEQQAQIEAGAEIVIVPHAPEPELWEPEGGEWYFDERNKSSFSPSADMCRLAGRERATEVLAIRAAKESLRHDLIGAYRDKHDPDGKQTHAVLRCDDGWEVAPTGRMNDPSAIEMSEDCAEQLAADLNSGRVKLPG